jgi:hypothetical protein
MNTAHIAFFLFFALACAHAQGICARTLNIDKEWSVAGNNAAANMTLHGYFAANGSVQNVSRANAGNGTLSCSNHACRVEFLASGSQNRTFRATGNITVLNLPYYDADPAFAGRCEPAAGYRADIAAQACALRKAYVLETVASVTEWVHGHMIYDLVYFGLDVPPEQVYDERRGVCVQYAVLEKYMLESIGINSSIVDGAVESETGMEPHSWLVVHYGDLEIAADPTFGQAGAISNGRAIMKNEDENETLEMAYTGTIVPEYVMDIGMNASKGAQGACVAACAGITYSYENLSGALNIRIRNLDSKKYVVFPYLFLSPRANGFGNGEGIAVLAPGGEMELNYTLDVSGMAPGTIYSMPISVEACGAQLNATLEKEIPKSGTGNTGGCAGAGLVLAAAGFFAALRKAN